MQEKNYFSAKIEDLICREAAGEGMVFSAFLTAEEGAAAAAICKNAGAPFLLYGGYAESERKMLVVSSFDEEILKSCFPFVLLRVCVSDPSAVSNRDVLGALMATGIRREMLGDIIARDGLVAFFAAEHIKDFLIQNVESIGRFGVQLMEASPDIEIPKPHFKELRLTVASMRADAVVGALCNCSRDQANRLIDGKFVSVNHQVIEKKTKEIRAEDCVVVRGSGKWIIDQCGDLTKKGRAVLLCRKYI